jgi:tetratricopeptide (TPR) repeat protein
LSQLWQLPLFIVSVGLFIYAGYLLINPSSWATVDQKIDVARKYMEQDRPDAAWQQLARLLQTEKLPKDKEATVHMMLATAMDVMQHQQNISLAPNNQRIIEQTEMAQEMGITLDSAAHRRLAESYAALGKSDQAVANFRQAIMLDPDHSLNLRRKMIELQLAGDDAANADSSLDEYLQQADLTEAERGWALDQRAGILIDKGNFADARGLLADAIKLDNDPVDQGQFDFQLGYCDFRQGLLDESERYLRLSRDLLKSQNATDADAAYYLGKIYQTRKDAKTAKSFYEVVLSTHPDSKVAPLARLGRGVTRIMAGDTDAGLADMHDLVADMESRPALAKYKNGAINELHDAEDILTDRQDYQSTIELLGDEQDLDPSPKAGFYIRLGQVYEKRANQIDSSIADAGTTEQIRRTQQVRDFRTKAGDAYVIYSRDLTLADDKGYSDALWKGIDLYDQAGALPAAISALELFVNERPDDRLAPDALLRLGQAYLAAGLFDKAIAAYQQNQFRYPKSLAASKSAVPLARAYISKGPQNYAKAERVLLSIVEDNPLVDPAAEEFKQSLKELAQLYYRTGRYETAIARLQELTERYPTDEEKPQLVFMMADSYRKSAAELATKTSAATQPTDAAETEAARRDRLTRSKALYDQVIDLYTASAPANDTAKQYLRLAYFYRADCMYDLGKYEDAIKLYDAAAFNYQDDPSSVSAYVQIVNSYFALGKKEEAKAANNRAKWMLQHMPANAFTDGSFTMPKKYWDQWLQWTNDSGMW